jgi:ketosteroid isomerase-like protein
MIRWLIKFKQFFNQEIKMQTKEIQSVITDINTSWDAAFNAKWPAQLAALYDADATVLPAGAAQVSGTAAISEFWADTIAQGIVDHKIELLEVGVDGNLAFQRGLWSAAVVNAEGERQTFNGNLHVLYRLQGDGSWKALTHIWN